MQLISTRPTCSRPSGCATTLCNLALTPTPPHHMSMHTRHHLLHPPLRRTPGKQPQLQRRAPARLARHGTRCLRRTLSPSTTPCHQSMPELARTSTRTTSPRSCQTPTRQSHTLLRNHIPGPRLLRASTPISIHLGSRLPPGTAICIGSIPSPNRTTKTSRLPLPPSSYPCLRPLDQDHHESSRRRPSRTSSSSRVLSS